MTKFPALMLSLLLLLPAASMAAQDQPMMICGKVKNTIAYKNKKRKINYRYVVIEEYDSFAEEDGAAYNRHLPYGLYMFRVDPDVTQLGDCFEIDTRRNLVTSSTVGD